MFWLEASHQNGVKLGGEKSEHCRVIDCGSPEVYPDHSAKQPAVPSFLRALPSAQTSRTFHD